MTDLAAIAVCGLAAYLLGSIPFGLLIASTRGVDIRTVGSGNIGATNVFRSVGKSWGLLTFACDALKGAAAALLVPRTAPLFGAQLNPDMLQVICACLVVAGHNWPVFLRFRGGKGVATSAGALLGIAPAPLGIGLLTWLAVFLPTHMVSAASIAAAALMAVCGWVFYLPSRGPLVPAMLTVLALLAVWRHRANIKRILNGTENRFEFGRRKRKPPENGAEE